MLASRVPVRRIFAIGVAAAAVLAIPQAVWSVSDAPDENPAPQAVSKSVDGTDAAAKTAGVRELAPSKCTFEAASSKAAEAAKPGDTICFTKSMAGERLEIKEGGTPEAPKVYDGKGTQEVKGITIEADNVIVKGFVANKPKAPGIEIVGNGVTVQDNKVTSPQGGDYDGLRFFGNNLKILHNTISETSNDSGAHADCMQTFQSDTPSSEHVTIDGNRCEKIDNMCLMAEGPNEDEGDGKGNTEFFDIKNNYCETLKAGQHLMFEDVQHVTIDKNEFVGETDRVVGLDFGSTDATVGENKVDSRIKCYVGISDNSRKGYKGPEPKCGP